MFNNIRRILSFRQLSTCQKTFFSTSNTNEAQKMASAMKGSTNSLPSNVRKLSPQEELRRRKAFAGTIALAAGVASFGGYLYYTKKDALVVLQETFKHVDNWMEDVSCRVDEFIDNLSPMSNEPLLPDSDVIGIPDHIPTLVIDLNKVLCLLEHDSRTGWTVIRRPGADQFFKELQLLYEIVIWSDDVAPVPNEVIQSWQKSVSIPITGVICRDLCQRRGGAYVKDISRLGRDLRKVIIIDHEEKAFGNHSENGILIREFDGNPDDRELINLLEFLKSAAQQPELNTRFFIEQHGGGDVDLGRRFMVEKIEKGKLVEKKRSFSKRFSTGGNNNSNQFKKMF